jgi:hypothetical protein
VYHQHRSVDCRSYRCGKSFAMKSLTECLTESSFGKFTWFKKSYFIALNNFLWMNQYQIPSEQLEFWSSLKFQTKNQFPKPKIQ